MKVFVRDGNIRQAVRVLTSKLGKDGSLRELNMRAAFPKPSDRRRAKARKATWRRNKKK